jgi:hypothetical protein
MLLLAILTGYPAQATEILRTLIEEDPPENWWEFIASFKIRILPDHLPQQPPKPNSDSKVVEITDSSGSTTPPDRTVWIELFQKLSRLEKWLNNRPCQEFNQWAPRVARYSFQSGRVLLSREQ